MISSKGWSLRFKVFCFEKSEKDYQSLSLEEQQEEVMQIKNGLNFARKVLSTDGCDILILDTRQTGCVILDTGNMITE